MAALTTRACIELRFRTPRAMPWLLISQPECEQRAPHPSSPKTSWGAEVAYAERVPVVDSGQRLLRRRVPFPAARQHPPLTRAWRLVVTGCGIAEAAA